jgi:hypothetical protein
MSEQWATHQQELYDDYASRKWCKWCDSYQQVKQEMRDEVCLEVCLTCGNVIDPSAEPKLNFPVC